MTRRDQIIHAAARLFREKGYRATSIRDLGEGLGITSAALYYHFRNKDEILCEVMRHGIESVRRAVEAAMAPEEHADDRIRAGLRAHLMESLAHQDFTAVLLRERRALRPESHGRVVEESDAYERLWKGVLGDAYERGLIKEGVDIRLLRLLGLGAMNWVTVWYREEGGYRPEQVADAFLDMVMNGVFQPRLEPPDVPGPPE